MEIEIHGNAEIGANALRILRFQQLGLQPASDRRIKGGVASVDGQRLLRVLQNDALLIKRRAELGIAHRLRLLLHLRAEKSHPKNHKGKAE